MLKTITLKEHPEIKRIITAAFPSYKKHAAFLSPFGDYGANLNSYWDGGSRAEHAIVDLGTLQRKSLPTSSHPYFDVARAGLANTESASIEVDRVGNITLKVLPEGYALVTAGTSAGKPATAHVRLNPANLAKLLGEAA